MRNLLIALIAGCLIISGCATTSMKVKNKDGTHVTWKSVTVLKNVKDAYVKWGTFTAILGSSAVDSSLVTALGDNFWLDGGPLLDMTGRSREPTAAEAAARFDTHMDKRAVDLRESLPADK